MSLIFLLKKLRDDIAVEPQMTTNRMIWSKATSNEYLVNNEERKRINNKQINNKLLEVVEYFIPLSRIFLVFFFHFQQKDLSRL